MSFKFNLSTESVQAASPVKPRSVAPETTIRAVLGLLKQHGDGSVLVCRDGVLAGIFTERDALKVLADDADLDAAIDTVMVSDPVTIDAGATVGEAIRRMSAGGYRRLPLIDAEGRAVGVVKVSGIVHYLVEHVPEVVYNLPPQPRPMTQEREGA